MRHLAASGINLLIVGLLGFVALIGWGINAFHRAGPTDAATVVEIPRGADLDTIAGVLRDAGVVDYPAIFRIGVRYLGVESDLKFGVYRIEPGASMERIAGVLAEGGISTRFRITFGLRRSGVTVDIRDNLAADTAPRRGAADDPAMQAAISDALASNSSVTFRVTVPEGLTSRQIVAGLERIAYLEAADVVQPPEGALAPNTYEFRRDAAISTLLVQMEQAQARILDRAWAARDPGLPFATKIEALTLASIIERETGVGEERPLVASVFINRLRRGMRLETDPTIVYGITRGIEPFDRAITRSDIAGTTERRLHGRVEFNTYQIDGLPPTPIANPGRAAIEAALNPADSAFFFFVADGTGGHAFAETYDEHLRNVARWQEIQSNREQN
ncbi:MAG: endolytic transglycosylase MltG [Pseudomonadota bacterium]